MPMFGLGCRRAESDEQTERSVEAALEVGYRLIDTASVYENERAIGRALRSSSVPRRDLFITTKVWNSDQGYDRTIEAFENSLNALNVEYIDLYLLQWPMIRLRTESWRALVKLAETDRCRAIGVCNFTIRHLEEIINDTGVVPTVNQVEFNPYLNQAGLLRWCHSHEIQLVTDNPIPRGNRLRDPRLVEIAGHYGKSPSQILLRWNVQKGVTVLTRASGTEEVAEHADIFDFEISLKDMDWLNGFHENYRVHWDPTKAP
jgi:methylglyoxal/glyoxal reductase